MLQLCAPQELVVQLVGWFGLTLGSLSTMSWLRFLIVARFDKKWSTLFTCDGAFGVACERSARAFFFLGPLFAWLLPASVPVTAFKTTVSTLGYSAAVSSHSAACSRAVTIQVTTYLPGWEHCPTAPGQSKAPQRGVRRTYAS